MSFFFFLVSAQDHCDKGTYMYNVHPQPHMLWASRTSQDRSLLQGDSIFRMKTCFILLFNWVSKLPAVLFRVRWRQGEKQSKFWRLVMNSFNWDILGPHSGLLLSIAYSNYLLWVLSWIYCFILVGMQMSQDLVLAVKSIQKPKLGAQVLQWPHCITHNSPDTSK